MPRGGVILLGLATALLTNPATHAEESSADELSVTVSTSCTLYGTIDTPHTATIAPGIYTEDIGQTTIKAVCNDINGFSLYSVGYTDNTIGKTVLASDAGSTYDIPTGTATSGTSNWAMKVNAVTGPTTPTIVGNFDNYHAVPDDYTKVAGYGGTTDSTDGSSVTTTYAVYIAPSQMTGTYTGKVKYIMVHPSTANGHTITYNPNGGTVSPSSEVVALGTSTTLPKPTQAGYVFLGWYTAATGGDKIGDAGATYSPTENITMHAHWQSSPDLFAISTMQEMTSGVCEATTRPDSSATEIDSHGSHVNDTNYVPRKTLRDTRDNTNYLVSKLADGNCWMSQNLELKLTKNVAVEAYNFNTDSTYSFIPNNTTQTTTGTTWPESGGESRSYAFQNNTYYGGTDISTPATASTTGEPYEKAGVLYNWYAATAGSGTTTATSEVTSSICPKGWRLPANDANASNSFSHLAGVYGLPTTNTSGTYSRQLQFPLQFNRPGYYNWNYARLDEPGVTGTYWSSVGGGSTANAKYFYFRSGFFNPQNGYNKGFGFNVRCLADD